MIIFEIAHTLKNSWPTKCCEGGEVMIPTLLCLFFVSGGGRQEV